MVSAAKQFTGRVLLSVCDTEWCELSVRFAKVVFPDIEVLRWNPGDPYPDRVDQWEGDWLISFWGDFIFPEAVCKRARKGAINFHPATPAYRGIGGMVYAIYNGDETYGSTCHHIAPAVDSGRIIDVARFKIAMNETASSLRLHVGTYGLQQFLYVVTEYLLQEKPLPTSRERWGEHLHTRAELRSWTARTRQCEPDHFCFR